VAVDGVGPNAVASKVARGWLRRVHRGVYAVGALESESLVLGLTTHQEVRRHAARNPAPRDVVEDISDLYWPAHRLVVEFDGWSTHSSRTAFERDRLKDAALQLAGERVLRVTGRQLEGRPEAVVGRLATAISAIRPRDGPLVN